MNTGTVPTDKMTWALDSAISLLIAREMTGVAEGLNCAKVQLQQLREELEQVKNTRWHDLFWKKNAEVQSLRSELAVKDKELEWYGGGSEDGGEKARSILEQYARSAIVPNE